MRKGYALLLSDNAMLYKDMTQWIRNKTFIGLFFGLLLLSEFITVMVIVLPESSRNPGSILFNILLFLLFGYGAVTAIMGYSLTNKEFTTQTYELYEMAGMSLEKMVSGKVLSLLAQFYFGFFCILPFIFVSYILRGLDFLVVLTVTIGIFLGSVPFFLAVFLFSLMGKTIKVGWLGRAVLIFFMLNVGIYSLFISLVIIFGPSGGTDLWDAIWRFFSPNLRGGLHLLTTLAVYAQVCLLLFYTSCQALSRANDSREAHIKGLALLLCVTWPFLVGLINTASSGSGGSVGLAFLAYLPLYILFLLIGLGFFLNRVSMPPMVRIRMENSRKPLQRHMLRFLGQGSAGTVRFFLAAFALLVLSSLWMERMLSDFVYKMMSLMVQTAWFLAIPAAFLLLISKLRGRYKEIRIITIAMWVVGSIIVAFLSALLAAGYSDDYSVYQALIQYTGIVLSPLISIIYLGDEYSEHGITSMLIRTILGGAGLFVMFRVTARRILRETAPLVIPPSRPPAISDPEPSPQKPDPAAAD